MESRNLTETKHWSREAINRLPPFNVSWVPTQCAANVSNPVDTSRRRLVDDPSSPTSAARFIFSNFDVLGKGNRKEGKAKEEEARSVNGEKSKTN